MSDGNNGSIPNFCGMGPGRKTGGDLGKFVRALIYYDYAATTGDVMVALTEHLGFSEIKKSTVASNVRAANKAKLEGAEIEWTHDVLKQKWAERLATAGSES